LSYIFIWMSFLKQLQYALAKTGLGNKKMNDDYRRKYVVIIFSFVCMFITFAMATNAIFIQDWILAVVLYLVSFGCIYSLFYQQKYGNNEVPSNIILYSLMVLMVYLLITGGTNNTGPIWIFIISPVAFFLHGLMRGLFELTIFLAIYCTLMFSPNDHLLATSYEQEFKVRILLSFLTVTFLSAFFEFSRDCSYKKAISISKKFEHLSKVDWLTKLINRREGMEKLEYEYHRMIRTQQPLTILLGDLDHFKGINDTHGHQTGDKLLISLANLFKEHTRAQDTVARWGGEEFLFILPQTDLTNAQEFSNKLHAAIRKFHLDSGANKIQCTMSIGMHQLSKDSKIIEALQQVDQALYQAKAAGRNRTMPHVLA